MKGPLTVNLIKDEIVAIERLSSRDWEGAHYKGVDLAERVMLAIADGHPHSARLAKAALRAFDV